MAALKIFAVRNKTTRQVERLIKAGTRGQVQKFLVASIEIDSLDAVDLADLMDLGLKVEDGTQVSAGEGNEGGEVGEVGEVRGGSVGGAKADGGGDAGGEPSAG